MKICFVLPKVSYHEISGGYKMVYYYANNFAKKNYRVCILYLNNEVYSNRHAPKFIKKIMANHYSKISPSWIELDDKIELISGLERDYKNKILDVDIAIATAFTTFFPTLELFRNKKICYFIQGFETWGGVTESEVIESYKKCTTNIVVSKWLKEKVDKYTNTKSILIPNPIDSEVYHEYKNNKRIEHSIGLLYHTGEYKGLKYSINAIFKLKEQYDDLQVFMFGVFEQPKDLPEWIHYTQRASEKETVNIYNKVKVFLCASIDEGFGLTGLEAMVCGAALVSTNYPGVMEYAVDQYNALLSPVRDVDSLVNNVSLLFNNAKMWEKLSNNGKKIINQFSVEKAYDKFESTLLRLYNER